MLILVNVFSILSAALFFFKKISPIAFLISALLWFGMMITFWFVLPMVIYKKSATFKDMFTVNLSDAEFSLTTNRGGRSWPWKSFSTLMESPHFFHLYFDSRSFFIVPKEAFETTALQEARRLLKEKIKK